MSRRRLAVVVFGLGMIATPIGYTLVGALVTQAVAQEEDELENVDLRGKSRQDLIVIQPAEDNSNPQSIYLELAKQKALLLTPEELVRETELLRRELVELEANHKLRDAERLLQQLIDEHPGSGAAERALIMLGGGRAPIFHPEQRRPTITLPNDELVPDNFRRHQPKFRFDEVDERVIPPRKPRLDVVPLDSGSPQF